MHVESHFYWITASIIFYVRPNNPNSKQLKRAHEWQTHGVERVFNIIYAMMNTGTERPRGRTFTKRCDWLCAADRLLKLTCGPEKVKSYSIQPLKINMFGRLTYLGHARHLHLLWDANHTKQEQIQIQNSVSHWLLFRPMHELYDKDFCLSLLEDKSSILSKDLKHFSINKWENM